MNRTVCGDRGLKCLLCRNIFVILNNIVSKQKFSALTESEKKNWLCPDCEAHRHVSAATIRINSTAPLPANAPYRPAIVSSNNGVSSSNDGTPNNGMASRRAAPQNNRISAELRANNGTHSTEGIRAMIRKEVERTFQRLLNDMPNNPWVAQITSNLETVKEVTTNTSHKLDAFLTKLDNARKAKMTLSQTPKQENLSCPSFNVRFFQSTPEALSAEIMQSAVSKTAPQERRPRVVPDLVCIESDDDSEPVVKRPRTDPPSTPTDNTT